jgi:acetyl esterase/lipase
LHFIGPEPETCSKPNILLYFHGRGYFDSVSSTQIAFALRCANTADATLVLLEYTLSNEAACPRQLEQANEALRYVLRLAPAENVLLAGDSAGGHLIAGLLSWIMHPDLTPAEEESILLGPGEKLGGVCLISPMLSFDWGKPSYSINAKRDYLNVDTVFEMLEVLKPPEITFDEALNIPDLCPSDAPEQWWANMPVERLMITVGSWEVFFDSAAEFAEKVSRDSYEGTKVELIVGWREWHAAPIVDPLFW